MSLKKNYKNLAATGRNVRPTTTREWNEDGRSVAARESFSRNTAKLWNCAPASIKEAKTMYSAKNLIKQYCKTLPV